MEIKNTTSVLIDGKVYSLSGFESEDYIQRVALYINNKIKELKVSSSGKVYNSKLSGVLLSLNVADELFKEKEKSERLKEEVKGLDKRVLELLKQIEEFENVKKGYQDKINALEENVEKYKNELNEYIEIFDDTNE